MGRFESNALAPRYRHHPPRDSRDLDGRLSGSLAAFKFAISAHFKKSTADSFRKDFAPRPILLFQKMRGWLSKGVLLIQFNSIALPPAILGWSDGPVMIFEI